MKIHISFEIKEGPWGGGNQFLKAIRDYFIKNNAYAHKAEEADVLLFNSHQVDTGDNSFYKLWELKKKNPNIIFVHRVDGPILLGRGTDYISDKIIFAFNSQLADGTIFQSNWSAVNCRAMGMGKTHYETLIMNSPNPGNFYRKEAAPQSKDKIRLITTTWSTNPNKGFHILQDLDKSLDYSKYSMTFVGNSPVKFKNFISHTPLPSTELANLLRKHDIFFTACKNDSCSNSLIEALHCGLPVVCLNSGGNPEIVGTAGILFNHREEVIPAINKLSHNLKEYSASIKIPSMEETGEAYFKFCKNIVKDKNSGNYQPKSFPWYSLARLKAKTTWYRKRGWVLNRVIPLKS
jgi:glycosyltransferase involved in cell wall biosynthesis